MNVEVIGPGCPRCQTTEQRVKQALDDAGINATVEKVDEQMDIIDRGVMHTPAVAVDGDVRIEGEIPGVDELVDLFQSV